MLKLLSILSQRGEKESEEKRLTDLIQTTESKLADVSSQQKVSEDLEIHLSPGNFAIQFWVP